MQLNTDKKSLGRAYKKMVNAMRKPVVMKSVLADDLVVR